MKLSYSLPLSLKSRCKHCESKPLTYYFMAGKVFKNVLKSSSHEISGEFLDYSYKRTKPKKHSKMSNFNYQTGFANVGTAQIRFNRYLTAFRKMQIVVVVTCECKKTSWKITAEPRFGIAEIGFDYELKPEP